MDESVWLLQRRTLDPLGWSPVAVWVEREEAVAWARGNPDKVPNGWQVTQVQIAGKA